MRIHRFYIDPEESSELNHDFWLHDPDLIHQWTHVLRFAPGQEVVLFDGREKERLYKLLELNDREAHLQLVTDYVRKTPSREIYLFWALLKKDKNDWVLQKCTELGVSHFIPLLADRCDRWNLSQLRLGRWRKIVIEASEQCGRSDIPTVREPMSVETAINDYKDKIQLLVANQDGDELRTSDIGNPTSVFIGPEGGWSGQEKELFKKHDLKHLNLHDFTLRAETACVTAVTKLLQ